MGLLYTYFSRSLLNEAQMSLEERDKELESMKNAAVHQQTTEQDEKDTQADRETQRSLRPERDNELRATLTLQREWRKTAARVSEWVGEL